MRKKYEDRAMRKKYLGLLWCAVSCFPAAYGRLESPLHPDNFRAAKVIVTRLDKDEQGKGIGLEVGNDGVFKLPNLPEGEYLVEAIVPGHKVKSTKMQLNGQRELTISLEPLGKSYITLFDVKQEETPVSGEGAARLDPPTL